MQRSLDLELEELFFFQFFFLSQQDTVNATETLGFSSFETLGKESQTVLHEPEIVTSLVNGLAHIAYQVFEERADHNIEHLNYLNIQDWFKD